MEERFKEVAARVNEKNHFLENCSLRILDMRENYVLASMDAKEDTLNPYGMVHGGALFTLADMAAGICALTNGPDVVTLNSSMNFIRAARPGKLYATAKTMHAGKSTGVYQVEIYDDQNKLLATALFTMYFFRTQKPHVPHA